MANRRETGEEFLLNNGVPEEVLGLVLPSGLRPDYLNHYVSPRWRFENRYNPTAPDNQLKNPGATETIRDTLKNIPTYRGYWEGQIGVGNTEEEQAEAGKMIDLITGVHPATETLDALARGLHRMAANRGLNPEQLVKGFIRSATTAEVIFYGTSKSVKQVRTEFGIEKKPPRKNSSEIVTKEIKELRKQWK